MKDYTLSDAKSIVVTIEAIFPLNSEYEETVSEALDNLASEGRAVVIRKSAITNSYTEACEILEKKEIVE